MRFRDAEFEFALFGVEHDGLTVHAADHVEGRPGLAAQGQFQQVVLQARFEGLLEFGLDLEEPVGRTETPDALMGATVVVVFDPEFDPLPGRLKALELGAGEELAPDGGPEAFDLAQGHGMMGAALDVGDPILFELGLETADTAPCGVLAPVVGKHLLGRLILAGSHPVNLDDRMGRGAAEQVRARDEPGIIIQVGNQVGVFAAQPEGEDVALPHLVGGGPLEEPWPGEVALAAFGSGRLHQAGPVQPVAHGLRAGGQQEEPSQQLTDAAHPELGMLVLEGQDLFGDGLGQLVLAGVAAPGHFQPRDPVALILLQPVEQAGVGDGQLLTDHGLGEPALQDEFDGLEFELGRIAGRRRAPGAAPGRHPVLHLFCFVHR